MYGENYPDSESISLMFPPGGKVADSQLLRSVQFSHCLEYKAVGLFWRTCNRYSEREERGRDSECSLLVNAAGLFVEGEERGRLQALKADHDILRLRENEIVVVEIKD